MPENGDKPKPTPEQEAQAKAFRAELQQIVIDTVQGLKLGDAVKELVAAELQKAGVQAVTSTEGAADGAAGGKDPLDRWAGILGKLVPLLTGQQQAGPAGSVEQITKTMSGFLSLLAPLTEFESQAEAKAYRRIALLIRAGHPLTPEVLERAAEPPAATVHQERSAPSSADPARVREIAGRIRLTKAP